MSACSRMAVQSCGKTQWQGETTCPTTRLRLRPVGGVSDRDRSRGSALSSVPLVHPDLTPKPLLRLLLFRFRAGKDSGKRQVRFPEIGTGVQESTIRDRPPDGLVVVG